MVSVNRYTKVKCSVSLCNFNGLYIYGMNRSNVCYLFLLLLTARCFSNSKWWFRIQSNDWIHWKITNSSWLPFIFILPINVLKTQKCQTITKKIPPTMGKFNSLFENHPKINGKLMACLTKPYWKPQKGFWRSHASIRIHFHMVHEDGSVSFWMTQLKIYYVCMCV